jgi:hypothetical protein
MLPMFWVTPENPLEVGNSDPMEDELRPRVTSITVSEGYFETTSLPLLQGSKSR